jgi:putative SOS response-associated peptidase YedK
MCGRYRLSRRKELLAEYFGAEYSDLDWEPRYNIAPTQPVATVRQVGTSLILSNLRWGLIPYWAKDSSIGNRLINGRSETVLQKPAFSDSFRQRRCLIPADGFYEWKKLGKTKQPFHFGMKDDSLFAFRRSMGSLEISERRNSRVLFHSNHGSERAAPGCA